MTANLFGRHCALTIGTKRISGLRIAFNIEKNTKKDPNKATILVSNLSKETRSIIDQVGLPVILEAGYEEQKGAIFIGETYKIAHRRNGTDIETAIECADGGEEVKRKSGSWSFSKNQNVNHVIRTLVNDLGLQLATSSKIEPNIATFKNGWAFAGMAADAIDIACNGTGLNWFIEDGLVYIFKKEQFGDNSSAILLNSQTGMIGSPEEKEKDKESKARNFQVQCLINPNIKPKKIVKIESTEFPNLSGGYEVRTMKIAGDTHGQDWSMLLDLRIF